MKSSRIMFIVLGFSFLVMSGFTVFAGIMANSTPPSGSYMMVGMAIMCFCLSYLYPQFKQKDERMQLIRYKGMVVTFIATMLYLIFLNIGLQAEWFILSAMQVVHILSTLIICTVFISLVVYSKIY
ncbi:permease [Bacillus sinesaloumensis]|uniref:permease n=1 Tax=Litchfieldia sinesaloumensis TaxID=1926280 RepID=UPI00114F3EB0|nr:permease [Bacillus sinesaloumensis]